MKAIAGGLLALGTIALVMTAFVLALMIARGVWVIVNHLTRWEESENLNENNEN